MQLFHQLQQLLLGCESIEYCLEKFVQYHFLHSCPKLQFNFCLFPDPQAQEKPCQATYECLHALVSTREEKNNSTES